MGGKMDNLRSIKPVLMFVSVLSFVVSLVFTVKLLGSQATTGADAALFGGLAISAEFGKVILFSIGMMLLFVIRSRFSWIGVPLLIISLAFTILSVVGTLGALQVENAKATEKSVLKSAQFKTQNNQIQSLQNQIDQIRKDAASLPSNYYTMKEQMLTQASELEKQKTALVASLGNATAGTGAHNALYIALAKWFGKTTEEAKFMVMASYGIGLEALSLFCALFAFFGDYLLGKKRPIEAYEEPQNVAIRHQQNYNDYEKLRAELEEVKQLAATKQDNFDYSNWEPIVEEQIQEAIERPVGFMQPTSYSTTPDETIEPTPENLYNYWYVAYSGKANGKDSIAKVLRKSPTSLQKVREKARYLGIISTNGFTRANFTKEQVLQILESEVKN
jgi:predicted nuclease with TOPRIM domain